MLNFYSLLANYSLAHLFAICEFIPIGIKPQGANTVDLKTFTAVTRYMVVTDFGRLGTEGITFETFDAACDKYAETMDGDENSLVYSLCFGSSNMPNITAEAATHVAKRCNERAIDLPSWLYAALPSHPGVAA